MGRGLSEEFCGVELGDRRLNRGLVMVAEVLEHKAEESICAAIGDFHACKAAYRLFANPKVRPAKISEPHIQRSLGRARESSENLLIVHDTTEG